MGIKTAGILPKNSKDSEPYKEPKRPKRFEAEEASDGTFIIHTYPGKSGGPYEYSGDKHTAANCEEAAEKFGAFFSGKKTKKDD